MNYSDIYASLIEKALKENINKTSIYEKHHIKPRSMGGSDSKDNLVSLTPRQHFIAHRLLEKMTKGTPDHYKMLKAVYMMSHEGSKTGYTPNSRTYSNIRLTYIVEHTVNARDNLFNNPAASMTGMKPYFKSKGLAHNWITAYTKLEGYTLRQHKAMSCRIKNTLITLAALHLHGANYISGLQEYGKVCDELIDMGLVFKVEGEGLPHYSLTDKFKAWFDTLPKDRIVVKPLYEFLLCDGVTKGKRGLGEQKAKLKKYNKANPKNMKKLLYLNEKYLTKNLICNNKQQ